MGKIAQRICEICNKKFVGQGLRFCTKSCRMKWQFTLPNFKKTHAERMSQFNPMYNKETAKHIGRQVSIRNKKLWKENTNFREKCTNNAINQLFDKNSRFGKVCGNSGYYKGNLMKSSWEIRFAEICDAKNEPWEYEPKVFKFQDGTSYIPDFYLPKRNTWVEVKPKCFFNVPEVQKKKQLIEKEYSINLFLLDKKDFQTFIGATL
jgi:hypothetical protein